MLAFFLIFQYHLDLVFFSLIVYLFRFAVQASKQGVYSSSDLHLARIIFLLYSTWITLSHVYYWLEFGGIDLRNVIQYFYNYIYIIWLVPIFFNNHKFEKYIVIFSLIYSLIVVVHFLFSGSPIKGYADSPFPSAFYPGWANGVVVPFLCSIYLIFNNKYRFKIPFFLIISFAIILTDSRISILSAFIIPFIGVISNNRKKIILLIFSLLIIILGYLDDIDQLNEIVTVWDRIDIYKTTLSYIMQRPYFGYGGNTIDQLQHINIDHVPIMNWRHTHNLILETILRYGIIGFLLFSLYLFSLIRIVHDQTDRYFIYYMIFLSLFQTYMKDPSFIILLTYFIYRNPIGRAARI